MTLLQALRAHPVTTVLGLVVLAATAILMCPDGLLPAQVVQWSKVVSGLATAAGLGAAADAARAVIRREAASIQGEEVAKT